MATVEECRAALDRLSGRLAGAEGAAKGAAAPDRSLSCRITDLDTTFLGRLSGGALTVHDTVRGRPEQRAAIRFSLSSEDLLALVAGELDFARAWASGRVRLEAPFRDLLRLRSLL